MCPLALTSLGVRRTSAVIGLLDLAIWLGHGGLRAVGALEERRAFRFRSWTNKRASHPSDPGPLAKVLLSVSLAVLSPNASSQDADPPKTPPPTTSERPAKEAKTAPTPKPGYLAVAFAKRLTEVLDHERTVQKYEQESLGAVAMDTLAGQRLSFRLRVDRDTEKFEARLEKVPLQPISLPRLSQATRELSQREEQLLGRITRAYGKDRDQRQLDYLFETNETFLATENWSGRDSAVRVRDKLLSQEQTYADLANTGHSILVKAPTKAELDDLEASLDEISPGTKAAASSMVQQLLTDTELQKQVLGELTGVLHARYDPNVPEESDDELLEALAALQLELLEAAQLTTVQEELSAVESELEIIDAALADSGVATLTLDQRRIGARRKAELMVARSKLSITWNHTDPPEPQATQLITAQDALIRRRLHDLGAHGALFAHRYDALNPTLMLAADVNPSTPQKWTFFDAQADLITSLDAARPAPNPLSGMTFRLGPQAGAGLPAALLGKLPKPKKGAKKKGK
ncbi:MAG: hypothetical protein ACI9EF_003098 [Pseudohongiellaceae bacterium]